MADLGSTNQLTPLALRYPEKTAYLGQVFNDTTTSYKLVWCLALLSLLRRSDNANALKLTDIFTEMVVIAWHPVCLYRLSFGRQDRLQEVIAEIQRQSQLLPNASPNAIRKFVGDSDEASSRLCYFGRYVPTRFLTPWFADRLRGEKDSRRMRKIEELALEGQKKQGASPYWLDRGCIRLNGSWRTFLIENMAVVQGFGEYHFAKYLQARNPGVPGIVNKMHAPTARRLERAHDFWCFVLAEFENRGEQWRFRDIYSERPLRGESFDIDHFLPWSFVTHDLLWNLTPVETPTNSKKGDRLPDLHVYLPRLADLHFNAVKVAGTKPGRLEDYADCFKVDAAGLLALGADDFVTKYREVIEPQARIAMNYGFEAGWTVPD